MVFSTVIRVLVTSWTTLISRFFIHCPEARRYMEAVWLEEVMEQRRVKVV